MKTIIRKIDTSTNKIVNETIVENKLATENAHINGYKYTSSITDFSDNRINKNDNCDVIYVYTRKNSKYIYHMITMWGMVYVSENTPTETQPTESQPTESQPTESQPTEEQPTEEIKHAVEEAKKAGVCYPYDENTDCQDCKDCINLHDCSFRGELARDEKCEMKQPLELYVDTEIPLLLNIKSVLESLFERVEKFKASYTWSNDNGNSSLRESQSKYFSIPKQSFTIFGDVYTLEFTVEYKRTSVYKYTYYTKNETRVTLRTFKTLYKKVCNELEKRYNQ